MKRKRVALSWSSGKDSAWTLHVLSRRPDLEIVALVTTVNAQFDRIAMHAVRRELLRRQAQAAGLPLIEISIPYPCSNADYERIMSGHIETLKRQGIDSMAFGDLFLEEVRHYRERQLQGSGIEPLFPLWKEDTRRLACTMIDSGVGAVLTCVDPRRLDRGFCGSKFGAALIAALPQAVDPCGENGEFHTFAFDGPMFHHPIGIAVGETVLRDGFIFTDLLAQDACATSAKA